MVVIAIGCRDESLYPLPYDDRTSGGYVRMVNVSSNIFDLNDLNNSGFEVLYEAVDNEGGSLFQEIEFWVSHRRGAGLTNEVLIKSVPASAFAPGPQPSGSIYPRALIRITANETLAALNTITADPDGPTVTPGTNLLVGFPGNFIAADQIVYRYIVKLTDGRQFSVLNPQAGVNSAFAKITEANLTPNITGGLFFNSPALYTVVVRSQLAGSWVGTYNLTQLSLWSFQHSAELHSLAFPPALNRVLFPDQQVTLSIPAGGLSTEREFTVNYRGANTTMRINLENGTVYVPLQNTGQNCTATRQIYWTYPTSGSFNPGSFTLPAGLPQATTTNRGSYSTASTGTTAGNVMTIGVDDDADEYGLRNGYCSWTLRVRLQLTKI